MISTAYTPSFIKQAKSLERATFGTLKKKIELFKDPKNHKLLKVHKLHGKLKNLYAFSVNNEIRVIFEYLSKSEVIMHDVGGHEIY